MYVQYMSHRVEAARSIKIATREVGLSHSPFIIAEVAQTHDGSLGLAHAFIDAVARTGAHAIKFQTHIADEESTPDEPFRVKFSRADKTRYDYWKRMEFTPEQWAELAKHASEKGLIFLSSPFSIKAVDLLDRIGMTAWKIGSGEVGNVPLLEHIATKKGPVLLSSGMSEFDELEEAVELFRSNGKDVALFQCTTAYPCPPEKTGLNVIGELASRFNCPVGLSDHSGKIFASLAAVALGASLIEVHVTLSKDMFGPDVSSSVTIDELKQLVDGSVDVFKMRSNPIDKVAVARDGQMQQLKTMFGRSIYLRANVAAGTKLTIEHLAFKKPGGGVPSKEYKTVLGRKAKRALSQGERLNLSDLE